MKLKLIHTLLLFGVLFAINGELCATTTTEESKVKKFDFSDKSLAQSALSGKKFCDKINDELDGHIPPSEKAYFCKKGGVTDRDTLKTKVATLTINSCQQDTVHDGYQRCFTIFNEIEGCTGANTPSSDDKNKETTNAAVIYNPTNDCIVTIFPPTKPHKSNACAVNCAG